jgi:monoamine oxidase
MQTETLIVGGGLSGLALADELERSGADYILVEARDRLGGRVLSHTSNGSQFDLGPAWFWPGQPLMASLIGRFGLEVFEQFSLGEIAFEDREGRVQTGAGFSSMQGSYRINGGISALIKCLADQIPDERMYLEHRVVALDRQNTGITATIKSAMGDVVIKARNVVLALPPRVANQSMEFRPSLPEDAARSLSAIPTWMAGQAKMLAIYDEPHWRHAGLSGDASSQKGPMVEIHDASPKTGGPYALFGFVGFPAEIRQRHRAELIDLAKAQLVRLFGAEMGGPADLIMRDWAEDDLTATPEDQISDGRHPDYDYPLSTNGLWKGRLLFGSTEIATAFGGYLEGALVAARDTMARIGGLKSVSDDESSI